MARVIVTGQDSDSSLSAFEKYQVYNGLDCVITHEVHGVLAARAEGLPNVQRTYKFQIAQQAPALCMALRGVAVNPARRLAGIEELQQEVAEKSLALDASLSWPAVELETGECPARPGKKHRWPRGVADADPEKACQDCKASRHRHKPFNAKSDDDCRALLYDLLGAKPQKNKKGILSTDKEVLDRLARMYSGKEIGRVVDAIRAIRKVDKARSMLATGISADNRFRSSFNVGMTDTFRWSSSKNVYRLGGNLQNIPEGLRYVFEADPGMEIFYADLKQAESYTIAHLADDQAYIDAHELGDTHTHVARLMWPELPWNGDIFKDKEIASSLYPAWDREPGHDYRFQAKRIQHGSNLGMTPIGVARDAHIPIRVAGEAQERYFGAFPGIRRWQDGVRATIKTGGFLVNPFGARRQFFDRPWDPSTHRKGFAFLPQSTVCFVIGLGLGVGIGTQL